MEYELTIRSKNFGKPLTKEEKKERKEKLKKKKEQQSMQRKKNSRKGKDPVQLGSSRKRKEREDN